MAEWDLEFFGPEINVIGNGLGTTLTLDKPNLLATVDNTTPLGGYEITYRATDSSESNSKNTFTVHNYRRFSRSRVVLLGENHIRTVWFNIGGSRWLVSDNRDDESNIVVLTMEPQTPMVSRAFIVEYQALDSAGNKSTQTEKFRSSTRSHLPSPASGLLLNHFARTGFFFAGIFGSG